jgi:excisionase family DNA binding protein
MKTSEGRVAQPAPILEGLIRSRDAAQLLGMSEWSIRKLAHEGELPYIQRATTSPMLFDPADLRQWIEREKIRK